MNYTSEDRPITKLKGWDKNPRAIKDARFEELKARLKRQGQTKPLIVTTDGVVIGGNMRLKAMQELGWETAWVSVVEAKTERDKFDLAITDNEEFGYYDQQQLAELALAVGLTPLELAKYEVNLGAPVRLDLAVSRFGPEVEEDEPPDVDNHGEPDSVLGVVYQLGEHRLLCGDATIVAALQQLMDGRGAAMVFTDPPYNVDYGATSTKRSKGRKILNDDQAADDFYQFLYDAISAMAPLVAGSVYICMSSSEITTLQKAFSEAGGHWSTFLIWVKNTFTMGRADYQRQYEPILYGWFDGSSHYWSGARNLGDVVKQEDAYVDALGHVYLAVEGLSTDVWDFPKPTRSKEHPTMKPVALCAKAIRESSKPGEIVLDPFLGSGSTLVAAQQLGRRCYGLELDPRYCDVIRKRYAKFVGTEGDWQKATGPAEVVDAKGKA